jgi:hypothetical protein
MARTAISGRSHPFLHLCLAIFALTAALPTLAAQRWVGGCGGSPSYITISSAISAAASGDEIVICPDTYPENVEVTGKSNLVIRGSTGNAADVVVQASSNNPTFSFSSGNSAINLRDLTVVNTRGNDGVYIASQNSGAFTLQNLKINKTTGSLSGNARWAIWIRTQNVQTNIQQVEIANAQVGVYCSDGCNNNALSISDVTIDASSAGIWLLQNTNPSNAGDITISNAKINSPSGIGIRIDQTAPQAGNVSIDRATISARDQGVRFYRNANGQRPNWSVTNSKITSAQNGAIWAEGSGQVGNLTFQKLDLLASDGSTVLQISPNNSQGYVGDVCITGGKDGVRLDYNTVNFTIQNSYFGVSRYGVMTYSSDSGSNKTKTHNSCFMKSYAPRAYTTRSGHDWDGNYWNGVLGGITYIDGLVVDHNTLGSCPVNPTNCSLGGGLHHLRIETDGSGLTCQREPVTFRACADATCSTLYTAGVTFTPSAAGGGAWYTAASGGSPITTAAMPSGSGTLTLYYERNSAGPESVTATSIAPAPTGSPAVTCTNDTTAAPCAITFNPCVAKFNACHNYASSSCSVSAGKLYTRLAGVASSYDIVALDGSGNVATLVCRRRQGGIGRC